MNKIEFSDVYKFLASLGLIFFGLAFFLPWFINQNNSLLILEDEQIQKLTSTAQVIIENQQKTLFAINRLLPYLSIGLIFLGLLLLFWGVFQWRRRQLVLDRIQDEELKSKEFLNISNQEKRNLIEDEIAMTEDINETVITSELDKQKDIDAYIHIENLIYLKVSKYYRTNYRPSQNIRIENFDYDIILKSIDNSRLADRIFEIKFFKKQLSFDLIKDSATKLIFACKNYEENFKRKTSAVLIIIYTENEYDETLKQYKKKIDLYGKDLLKYFRVNFFAESIIENIKASEFFK